MNRKMRRALKPRTSGGGGVAAATAPQPAPAPTSVPALFAAAVASHQGGGLAEAIAGYDRILRLKPDLAEVHCNRGMALFGLGRQWEAEAAYRSAIALHPNFADAYNNLGIALCERGSPKEAEQALRRAVRLKPQSPQCLCNLGIALKSQGKFAEAEAAQRRAIAVDANHADAYSGLGDALRCLGRLDEAEAALRRAIGLRPHFADAFAKLGNTLRERGRLAEAEAACGRAIAIDPQHAGAYSTLGNVLQDHDRLIEAEAAYRHAIMLQPSFAEAHNNLGAVLKQRGLIADAREVVERAVRLEPKNALHYLNLAEIRTFTAGDPYLAEMEAFAGSVASLPLKQQIELHFALAKAYDDIGRFACSFRQLIAGNALKRRQTVYDEAATLALFARIRAVFTPELMRSFRGAGDPSPLPVFIVGMPRSGTTLIEQILCSHPQVHGAGELPNFCHAAERLHAQEDRDCRFPDAVAHIGGEELRRLGGRYVGEITALSPAATRVVNKMPSNFFFAALIHLALPNARIIHAVRDPLDTCLSCFSKLFAAGQHHTYDLAELGRYYRHYRELMAYWRRVLPDGCMLDVRYEDVVADLEGQARRLLDHCGLEWDPRCLAFHETKRTVRTASATQVRQPLYGGAVGRARSYAPLLAPLLAEVALPGRAVAA